MVRVPLAFDVCTALRCALSGFPSRGVTFGESHGVVFDSYAIYLQVLSFLYGRNFEKLILALQKARAHNDNVCVVQEIFVQ